MIIFKNIRLKNFRNIRSATLNGLKDLNILIGPNNCGKTNILEFISNMRNLSYGGSSDYICDECQKIAINQDIKSSYLRFNLKDFYLNDIKRRMIAVFLLNERQVNELVPLVLEKQRKKIPPNLTKYKCIKDEIMMGKEAVSIFLKAKHLSPFIHPDILRTCRLLGWS